jgi:hypothetical protein
MELRMKIKGLLLATMFVVSSNASAALNTYFGQDQSPGGLVPVGGSTATAQADFLSAPAGVGIEDFESLNKLQLHDVKEKKGKERKRKIIFFKATAALVLLAA